MKNLVFNLDNFYKLIILIFAFLIMLSVYAFGHTQGGKLSSVYYERQLAQLKSQLADRDAAPSIKEPIADIKPQLQFNSIVKPQLSGDKQMLVLYYMLEEDPNSAFSAEEVTLVNKSIMEPFFDYYVYENNVQTPSFVKVTKSDSAGNKKYFGNSILYTMTPCYLEYPEHCGKEFSRIVPTSDGFWQPDCLGGCNLSETYKKQYPI